MSTDVWIDEESAACKLIGPEFFDWLRHAQELKATFEKRFAWDERIDVAIYYTPGFDDQHVIAFSLRSRGEHHHVTVRMRRGDMPDGTVLAAFDRLVRGAMYGVKS